MDGYMNAPNGYSTPVGGYDVRTLPSPRGVNGLPISPAMLTDAKSMRQHLAHGIATSPSYFASTNASPPRPGSEPPSTTPHTFDVISNQSKDDAYLAFNDQDRNRTVAPSPKVTQTPTAFDPRRLLDPKGFDPSQRPKKLMNPSPQPTSYDLSLSHSPPRNGLNKRDHGEFEGNDMGSFIERLHNVSQRDERPQKKQKKEYANRDSDEEQKKSNFTGGGKGGDIGEYMKEKRKEGQQVDGPVNTVVDLTGDEDDDVVFVSDAQDKEVCYGRLDKARVNAHIVPSPGPKSTSLSKTEWPVMKLQLKRFPGQTVIIRVLDPTGKDFGNIDSHTAYGLVPLMDSKILNIRIQARLNNRKKKPGETPGQGCSDYFDMTLNLYGPKRHAVAIGKSLSQKQIFFRNPLIVDNGVEVFNPHLPSENALPRTSLPGMSAGLPGLGYMTRTVEEIRNDVIGMFDSLEKSENLPEMEPDVRICTPLLRHQKQGLYFMTNKEKERVFSDREEDNSSLWRLKLRPNGQRVYYNVITGKEERTKPPEVLGGILADMMGLGKTLSILSLVVGSLNDSCQWAKQKPPPRPDGESPLTRNSKATLLVSPLSTIANWEEQIAAHVEPGTLSYYVYHGNNRCQDIDQLSKYDMIITTYNIISSEYNGRSRKRDASPLLQTNFFRIVLDEAHMIREQSTRQSQATCSLSAQRRWAVTGTPVQNRLDDLGALIKFLRLKPFDEKGSFTQFILSPFKNADPEIVIKLRLLVDNITLRRLKDRIDLPQRTDQLVRLNFSDEERVLYDWFSRDSASKMKVIAGGQKKSLGGKTYVHILRAIMRLRLICAHGKELLSEDDLKMTEGFSLDNAIDLEDEEIDQKPAMTSRQAYEMLMLFKETDADTCSQCARKIGTKGDVAEDVSSTKEEVIGYMLPCYQVVCKDCHGDFERSVQNKTTSDNHFVCPFCEQYLPLSFFKLTQDGIEAAEEARVMARENPRHAKTLGRYSGPHTKTKALIEALLQSKTESQDLPSDQPIKSVVFSGWTAHLDLIQIALEDNGIKYVRLDGKMTRIKRNEALEAFRDNPDVIVILVSIMAGGLGLNLTTGSKVYVMEPQFNPAAEAQAVDRIHRLGQKREVTTTRFIMGGSFEEKMLDLQRKKQSLADLSMNRGKLDKAEAAKQRLEELRSLFK